MKYKIPKGTKVLVATNNSTTANYPLTQHVMKHDLVLDESQLCVDSMEIPDGIPGPPRFFYSHRWGWDIPQINKTSDISPSNLNTANYDVFYTGNRWFPFIICLSPLSEIVAV